MSNEVSTQPRPLPPAEAFRQSISKMEGQIKSCLPSHVPVERFTRVVMTAIQKEPKLLDLDRNSLFASCLAAAADGLLPDGKESALVPFKGKVSYMPMVAGIMKKIRNSGELLSIGADVIKENDEFSYFTDEKGKHLKHVPKFGERGKTIGAYCLLLTKDGGVYIDAMDIGQLETIRKKSSFGNAGPWVSDTDEMYKKTVIKRTSKMAPMSTDMEDLFDRDDEANAIMDAPRQDPEPIAQAEQPKAPSKLAAAVGAKPVVPFKAPEQAPMSMTPDSTEVPI